MADYTNNTMEAFVAAGSVIDKMELEVTIFSPTERAFLAKYQTQLGSADTTPQDDGYFLVLLTKFMTQMMAGKAGQTA